ncbi:MAG: IS1182 family transposase, partial [Deltaproteobacteria bacterium]|nr:IS1182 family transposase [Kofleriaceae bacterium]
MRVARREQLALEVVDVDTLIPEDHPARLLASAVEYLDLSRFYEPIKARETSPGRAATDPKLLVSLWLYATVDGIGSARELERLSREHAAYRWLCGGVTVNHHLLAKFRVGYEAALDELLCEVIGKLMAAGLITLRRVAHDGMKVRASAGAASFRRRPRLESFVKEARAHVGQLKKSIHDPGHRTKREAAQLRAAQDRQNRVERALAVMPEVERTKARQTKKRDRKKAPRVSTTDPDARVMKMADGGFRPAYNLQLSTDVDSRFIVGVQVSTVGSDSAQLAPAIADIERRTGFTPEAMLVDGGYVNHHAFEDAADRDIVVYAPVPEPKVPGVDPFERKPSDSDETAAWRERMQTDEAKEIYRQRAATAETTNADLRCRRGLDRLLVRGTDKVLSVTLWAALAYNLL